MNFFPAHLHSNIEIVYIKEGSANISIHGKEFLLEKGSLTIVFPNLIHAYLKSSEDCRAAVLICGSDLMGEQFNQMIKYYPVNPCLPNNLIHEDVIYAINSLTTEAQKNQNSNQAAKKALTQLILARFISHIELKKSSTRLEVDITSKLITYVCDNFNNQLSLDLLSHELGVNKFYISRIFTKKIGTTFNDYVNSLRIEHSKNLLSESELSILEISNKCGFETQRSFNRIFKKMCNMPPMEYRKAILAN